jgi:hypothetical protein
MNQQDSLADRFATPPRDVEWEKLWGEQGPVDSVKALFPYSIAAVARGLRFSGNRFIGFINTTRCAITSTE